MMRAEPLPYSGIPVLAAPAPRRGGWAIPWVAAALILAAAPHVLTSGIALTMMSLIGIMVIFALSYNMLLGQTGMLSFGHAVYYGLGAFFTVHAMNAVVRTGAPVPLPVMPIVGGLAGLAFGVIFGSVSTRRGGTVFAMISLGLAELVTSSANILKSFFGGEEGIATDRTKLPHLFGIGFGTEIEVYYLIATWCLLCAAAMYGFTRTPLGRLCNAVRENPVRVQFIGYNPHVVRFLVFCISAFFAGIAGSLAAINFEIVNSASVGPSQSSIVLLATFVGGTSFFVGPVLGTILVTYLQLMLTDVTEIWQLYFGLLFVTVVSVVPSGIAGIGAAHARIWRTQTLRRLGPSYAGVAASGLVAGTGAVLLIEMAYRVLAKSFEAPIFTAFGTSLDLRSAAPWSAALLALFVGVWGVRRSWPHAAEAFDAAGRDGAGPHR